MATHSSVLAWRIPGMGEPGGLPSMGSQSRTRLKWLSSSSSSNSVSAVKKIFLPMQETWVQCLGSAGEGNGTPLQYSCLGNPMDRGTWWATLHGVPESHTRLTTEHMHAWCACTHTHTHTQLIYNAVLLSGLQQSDSVIYIYTHTFSHSFPLWFITGYWIQFSVLYRRKGPTIQLINRSITSKS